MKGCRDIMQSREENSEIRHFKNTVLLLLGPKLETSLSYETSENIYCSARRNIPQELNLYLHSGCRHYLSRIKRISSVLHWLCIMHRKWSKYSVCHDRTNSGLKGWRLGTCRKHRDGGTARGEIKSGNERENQDSHKPQTILTLSHVINICLISRSGTWVLNFR
jgi:hypothetical protein